MNCNCLKEIETELVNNQTFKGRNIQKATMEAAIVSTPVEGEPDRKILAMCTVSEATIKVEGMKRDQKFSIMHSFCPFCGIAISPYKKTDTDK